MLAAEQRTYQRHRPEQTLLYQLVEQHYPEFAEMMCMFRPIPITHFGSIRSLISV